MDECEMYEYMYNKIGTFCIPSYENKTKLPKSHEAQSYGEKFKKNVSRSQESLNVFFHDSKVESKLAFRKCSPNILKVS